MYILFDIGGTKMRVASATSSDNFNNPVILDTPQNYLDGLELLQKTILDLSRGQAISAIVGGIAGPWDRTTGQVLSSHNLPDWAMKPIRASLENTFHAKCYIDNDAAMVGLGEAVFGAGKGSAIVGYITVSTGVGGAKIVNGKLDDRAVGFEPGKQVIGENGETLESLVSGHALEEKTGKKPVEITDPQVWDDLARFLARGLNNIIVDWSPDVVVLGGSMMNTIGIPVDAVARYVKDTLTVYPIIPPIKKSLLGDMGGLYGGLAIIKNL